MKIDFEGKVILVTGSSRGIGKTVADKIEKSGGIIIRTNSKNLNFLDSPIKIQQSLLDLVEDHEKIHGIINNAGISYRAFQTDDLELEYDKFLNMLKVNTIAPYYVCHNLEKRLIDNESRIVNISSILGVVSDEDREFYSASKAGLIGLTKALAIRYAKRGILVNSVSPGYTLTDMTKRNLGNKFIGEKKNNIQLRRLAEPEEIANLICFLCSNLNTYITGENIVIDGGYVIK